jgi:hypothetical protein
MVNIHPVYSSLLHIAVPTQRGDTASIHQLPLLWHPTINRHAVYSSLLHISVPIQRGDIAYIHQLPLLWHPTINIHAVYSSILHISVPTQRDDTDSIRQLPHLWHPTFHGWMLYPIFLSTSFSDSIVSILNVVFFCCLIGRWVGGHRGRQNVVVTSLRVVPSRSDTC